MFTHNQKVVGQTEWINSIVEVERSDESVRLCLDPREPKKSMQKPYYPISTFEDIAAKAHGQNKNPDWVKKNQCKDPTTQ
ncbi:hypothetical protein QYM36_006254 [Artemia franciscana]|uniref:Uncharacterized protein n=1 Tax=Artemia franciscana TaxID=6661 RepID=A0AA88HYB4_ARTSF|nr:hypothetical protein QYM36_006254 [Artemia franciscana]